MKNYIFPLIMLEKSLKKVATRQPRTSENPKVSKYHLLRRNHHQSLNPRHPNEIFLLKILVQKIENNSTIEAILHQSTPIRHLGTAF